MNTQGNFESFDKISPVEESTQDSFGASELLTDQSSNDLLKEWYTGSKDSESVLSDDGMLTFPELDAFKTDNTPAGNAALVDQLSAGNGKTFTEQYGPWAMPADIVNDYFIEPIKMWSGIKDKIEDARNG